MENNFFKAARPIWVEGRDREWNVTVQLAYNAKDLKNATLTMAGASFYQVYLNEKLLHFGPARKAIGYAGVDVFPLPDVDEGTLYIRVAGYYIACYNGVITPSFIQAEIEQDGNIIAATGADGFECHLYTPKLHKVMRYSHQRQFSECYDFHRRPLKVKFAVVDPGVTLIPRNVDFADLDAKPARFLASAPYTMQENLKSGLRGYQTGPEWSFSSYQYPYEELESKPFEEYLRMVPDYSASCQRGTAGTVEHWDLGKIETGFVTVKLNAKTDCRIIVIYGEQNYADGRPNPIPVNGTNCVEWRLAAGSYELYSFEPYTATGLEIMITDGEALIEYAGITELAYSARKVKTCKVTDPELALVYQAAVDTFRHNAFDLFTDCPSRERAGWLCDSYYTAQSEFYFTGKTTVENEFLNNYLLGGGKREGLDGMVDMCYPSTTDGRHIPQWAMWYVLELYDYFTKRGRGDRKDDFKDQLYTLLDYFKRYENEFGLLEKLPSWNFVEWSKLNQRVHDVSWPTNMLYSRTVECIATLYDDDALLQKAADLRKTINEMAWNGKMYLDRAMRCEDGTLKNTDELSETCQYYAFQFGVADLEEERCAYLKDMVMNVFGKSIMAEKCPEIEPSNSLPGFYIRTELMLKWKMYPELIEYIKHFFLPMAQATGTLWENKTPGASCNHGFASFIAIAIDAIENETK